MFSTVPEFPFFGFAVRPAFPCGAAPGPASRVSPGAAVRCGACAAVAFAGPRRAPWRARASRRAARVARVAVQSSAR